MGAWVTAGLNACTGRGLPPWTLPLHVAMAGVLAVGGDLPRWAAGELARAAELVAA